MKQFTSTKNPEPIASHTDKLYMENTLLRIAGALFCHDPKRASTHISAIEINKGVAERHLVIRPDPQLGQPGPLAHRIFVALIKKHSDYGRPVQSEIAFTKRELMRLAGRRDWGGADSEQLSRALTQIQTTLIATNFKDRAGRYIEEKFHILSKTRIERREFASDPIEACTITLAEPIIASLRDDHFTCLNHALMMRLGTIGQALYMRLFFHFANRYDGYSKNQLSFTKRYDDICAEWLGGLTVVKYQSKVLDRLGPHLEQLETEGFLASHTITRARSQPGFVIGFRPGPTFFQDYDRFYRQRSQGELRWSFHAERRQISEPLQVAYSFVEKRTGQPAGSVAFVASKDVETAKQLLVALPAADLPAFFDYALAEARKTNFDIQTLGGTKQYLAGYLARRQRRAADVAQETARRQNERQEAIQREYQAFRRSQAVMIFDSLPDAERATIENQARAKAATFSGPLQGTMFDFNKVRFTIERHRDKLTTFEQWQAEHCTA